VIRLIRKWLKAGVAEDGQVTPGEVGTPQGAVISPLLANIYLHYVFDLWAEQWRKRHAHGDVIMVRYADDIVVGFEHQADAERFWEDMRARLADFALTLHPGKTRLIEFGQYAAKNAKKRGEKPATFNFLGFVHICARSRQGKFTVHVKTIAKRLRRGLTAIWDWCQQHRHDPVSEQQKTLNATLRGHYQYYGRPTNYRSIGQFYRRVQCIWKEWLGRRTRGERLTWERFKEILRQFPLLSPRITHPWGEYRESRLKNPLREICTVGSVRGENLGEPWWT